jgi:hypothetical protein
VEENKRKGTGNFVLEMIAELHAASALSCGKTVAAS